MSEVNGVGMETIGPRRRCLNSDGVIRPSAAPIIFLGNTVAAPKSPPVFRNVLRSHVAICKTSFVLSAVQILNAKNLKTIRRQSSVCILRDGSNSANVFQTLAFQ